MNEPAASSSPIAVFAIGFAFMRAWGLTYLGNNGVRFPLETMADIRCSHSLQHYSLRSAYSHGLQTRGRLTFLAATP